MTNSEKNPSSTQVRENQKPLSPLKTLLHQRILLLYVKSLMQGYVNYGALNFYSEIFHYVERLFL